MVGVNPVLSDVIVSAPRSKPFMIGKRLCAILVLLFCLLLFACRSQGNRPAVFAVDTTITLAAPPSSQAAYEHIIKQFQEECPQIQVQFVPLSGQQASLSLRDQAALTDVLLLEGQPPSADAAATFLNLAPLMAADPTFDQTDFWPGIMAACQAAGVQVGLPFRANASLIFFDKAAFDAAGLPYPEPGWNWEDFRQAVQALSASEGEQILRYGFVDGGNPLSLLAPLIADVIRQSGETLDSQRLAVELEWYVTLAGQGVIPGHTGTPTSNRDTLINNRQAAMWVGSQFDLNRWQTALGDDLAAAPFPTAAGTTSSNPVTAGCALISAGTNHSQAAWTLLHYLSQQALFTSGVYPAAPARPSVAQSSNYWAQLEPETAIAIRYALEQGWYRRAEMPELAAVGGALTQAMAGETSLAQSLPDTVEIQPNRPPPPPDTAIAVATPRATPIALDRDLLIVEYYSAGGGGHHDEALSALAQAFNDMQNNFEVRILSEPGRYDGTYIEYLAGAGDCLAYGGTVAGNIAFKDNFYSLRPFLDSEPDSFREDFDPYWWERNQIDGELYALPGPVRPYVVYYNVQLLAESGLDPPSPDWTPEDFWALAEAATRTEDGQSIYGFAPYELWPANLLRFVPPGTILL
jgi:multiple sugar transport system substrate-binding protein